MGKHLKPKVLKKPIEKYKAMSEILTGLDDNTKKNYKNKLARFCEWIKKTPDEILAERQEHLKSDDIKVKRTFEQKVIEYYEYLRKETGLRDTSARMEISCIQAFFGRNFVDLKFRRGDLKKPKKVERYVIPTIAEVREMVESTFSPRDKSVILVATQTGLAPVDIIGLKRAPFERAIQKEEYPVFVGKIPREKTGNLAHVFLMRDSGEALKRYFRQRKDNNPLLFVERASKPMGVNSINKIVKLAAERAGLYQDEDQLIKGYVLRKVFETQHQNAGTPQPWIDLMMGHEVRGSRSAYSKPSEVELLEKVRQAESFLSITHVRNVDILREKIDEARKNDLLQVLLMLEQTLDEQKMERLISEHLLQHDSTKLEPKKEGELEPTQHVVEKAFHQFLSTRLPDGTTRLDHVTKPVNETELKKMIKRK